MTLQPDIMPATFMWGRGGGCAAPVAEEQMARPDYLICLECESEVEDFIWRDGEVRRATCEVCGNTDADAFSLPEDFEQDTETDEEELEETAGEDAEDEEYLKDYDDYEEDEELEEEE